MGVSLYRNIGSIDSADYVFDSTYSFISGQNIAPSTSNLFSLDTLDVVFGLSTGGLFHVQLNLCESGDINNDQSIDVIDVNLIVDLVLFEEFNLMNFLCRADLDDNNDINIFDIILLVDIILNN